MKLINVDGDNLSQGQKQLLTILRVALSKKRNIDFNSIVGGMFVGIANIIPGVSGGTLALTLGIYEDILNVIIILN